MKKEPSEMTAAVRVQSVVEGYEVVLEDDEELVLAHFDVDDWDLHLVEATQQAREDAERYAAQVRRLLGSPTPLSARSGQ
jgi:hypothetical protein